MKIIGAYEAKTHLSRLLDEVERGRRITITRNGRAAAVLAPAPANPQLDRRQAVAEIKAARRRNRSAGSSIRQMIEDGRRL